MVDKVLHLTSAFTKSMDLPTASETIDSIMVEGYASTIDMDRQGDVVSAKVWQKGMENYLKNPVILAYHEHSQPVGRMIEHRVDDKGLWIKARISAAAEDVFNLIKDGVLTAFSIGFRIIDAQYDSATELFVVKELELHEISVVSVPANQNTIFSLSKSFDTSEELRSFKLQFALKSESAKELDSSTVANGETIKELNMDSKQIEQLVAEAAEKAAQLAAKHITDAQEKAAAEKAVAEKAAADFDAKIKAAVATVQTVDTGAERLLAEVEKRFAAEQETQKSAIAGLEAALKEKAQELEAIQKSRMQFAGDKNELSYADKEKAVLLAKMANKPIESTKFGYDLIQKYAGSGQGPHLPNATWEQEVSLSMEAEIRRRLVVAPLFRQIAMQTNVMKIPLNPETGTASWVSNSTFGSSSSAGNTLVHAIKEITLSAYKVATNEYTAYEEEEDSLIAIMPVIRDAMIRRIARAVDKAILVGPGTASDPVVGLAQWALGGPSGTSTAATTTVTGASTTVTVANLRAMRKQLGVWGLDPADVVYIVNTGIYYNLLEDTVFQTMNQVGPQATLLTGQIGMIGNSPVLVSGELNGTVAGAGTGATLFDNVGAFCVAPGNFIMGNQRGLRIDTQELVETQRRVMVASLRTGFAQVTNNYTPGVSRLTFI